MKILLINKFLHANGGSETYIFKLGDHFKALGHDVEYFGMEHEERIVGNSVNSYTSNMDFHTGSKFEKLTYPIKTIYSAEARKKLRLVLDDFCPDVCHLNNFNYQLTPSIILEIDLWRRQKGKNCKIIYTAHDYQLVCPNHLCYNPVSNILCEKCLGSHFYNCAKNKCIHGSFLKSAIGAVEGYFWKLKGVYKLIDTIICCSEFMKKQMDTNPLFASKTIVKHNFIDKPETSQFKKKDYVLYFGRFCKEKGVATLIKACENLPQIQFVFAGTGPLENELSNLPNIRNIGFATGEKLKQLISEAMFSICPSEWYENCPFSVMESLLYGTPVLGANIGGIPELVEDGVTGELFESGNSEELKTKILSLYEDREKLSTYTENCKLSKFYTTEQYCEELIQIYK